ncbi:MAG TPA: carboxypeptidase regulatory-like domain-containing protein [Acidobacteriaceae bacterium]|nr:carboxypeptidase regulatory-like domain-containing protein [Acidobacteriaceae bacterium]
MAGLFSMGAQTPGSAPAATQPPVPATQPTQSAAEPATPSASAPQASAPSTAPQPQGGTVRGTVIAGTVGKAGGVPLPGVAVTATNTLTGKKYAAATGIDGTYAMSIPRNGRYVVRAELAGFAPATQEVVLNASEAMAGITLVQTSNFGMQLASRAAAAEARQESAANATALGRGTQNLSLNAGNTDVTDASAANGNSDVAMPTLGNLGQSGGDDATQGSESIAVNGQMGQTNGLANFSEDEIRQRVQDAVEQARANGQLPQGSDPTNQIVMVVGGMMSGGGPGGGGGFRGGRGGGGGGGRGGGGGSAAFRNFNPAQPHGNVFYQGSNNALNSAPWSPTGSVTQPAGFQNRFGASIAGSPYIPGLTKPNTKQFGFLNVSGQRNLNSFLETGLVPTDLERKGDFSQTDLPNSTTPVKLYDPTTGQPIAGNNLANATVPISPQAAALLAYYPAANIPLNPLGYNYQTISNAGSNNFNLNARYVRTLGQAANTPFGRFGGGGGGGGRRNGGNTNAPPSLRQNINIGYNYSHSASDQRNIFLPLGGAQQSGGNGLNVGYSIGYGRLSNNATFNWNRLNTEVRNYFTNTSTNPSEEAGVNIPNNSGGFADPNFYNGLPRISISNYQSLSNTTPTQLINQTISFSDVLSWRHKQHNLRFGFDARRVHADSIGGNNPLGSFTFTGYATAAPGDQVLGNNVGQTSGSALADFLLGLPSSTSIQAGLFKTYLRENVFDWYVMDDYRIKSNLTLNYSVRYEYFGPYGEKNDHLVNLYPSNGPLPYQVVTPGNGNEAGLVHPDHTMFAPRLGFAYRPKNSGWTKDTVIRGGYSIMYNTGQYATFARNLSHQPPFAETQNNSAQVPTKANPNPTPTGCTTTQSAYTYTDNNGNVQHRAATTANFDVANGFGCGASTYAIQNNWAVDPNYRLGMVQLFNLNVQRTLPLGIVFNLGYNGSKGGNLDVVGSPNATPSGVTTPLIAPFDWEESAASSHANALVVSAQKRQSKGVALGFTYTYAHAIDNASGVGGAVGQPVQNLYRLDLEEGNSSFDQRHNFTGNWVIELPFGANRAFLNKGGAWGYALDGFSLSGTLTFATGSYFTPTYSGNQTEALSGNTFTLRPDRDFSQPIKGPGTRASWFNPLAFAPPATGAYGTASEGSIEGPGIVAVNAALSRTFTLGETRSLEARVSASNVFNTVQYSGIGTVENERNFGQVTSAAPMRTIQVQARYRF